MILEMSMQQAVPPAAREVLERLEAAGYQANLVGGCVRDLLRGQTPQDWDVCTSALPDQVVEVFGEKQVRLTGLRHGTVTVLAGGRSFEVTTYRVESTYGDNRHPDRVNFTSSLREDLARRDFTINAMALDLRGRLTDPYQGQKDLKAGLIRCVGDPVLRFREDALRILRALRFSARLGFAIHGDTAAAMEAEKGNLAHLSAERVGSEVLGMVTGPGAGETLDRYRAVFLTALPLLAPAADCPQNCPYHYGTVYQHTVDALKYLDRGHAVPQTALAILFHDMGKPATRTTDPQGRDHFYGHAQAGAELCRQAMTALRYPNRLREEVAQLVELHSLQIAPTPAGARRLLNKVGEAQLRRLIEVIRCDTLAHTALARPRLETLEELSRCLDGVLEEASAFTLKQLAVNGRDLKSLGIPPGPRMGGILDALLQEVLAGSPNDRSALLERARQLASN